MYTQKDYAFKIGCGRLIFEDHAMEHLPTEVRRLGHKLYLVTGVNAWNADGTLVKNILEKADIPYELDIYAGSCSAEKAEKIVKLCREKECDIIMGLGGGRIMDLAKTAANLGDLRVINVPTIAATCAAYTPLSVIYSPEGACIGTWYFLREIDCVIADVSVLTKEPRRYLASGIMDAMAKWVEINHYADRVPAAYQDELLARLLAENLYKDLKSDCINAFSGDTKAIRNVIFHNIVTTGIISGIARGEYQSALAHGLYYAIRTLYGKESKPYLHGEVVAVGMRFQSLYLGKTEQEKELYDLMKRMNMPVSLSDIHVSTSNEDLAKLAEYNSVKELYFDNIKSKEETTELLRIIC